MKKRLFRIAFLLPLLLIFVGCPEEPFASAPTGPSRSNNTWLLGVWETPTEKGGLRRAVISPVDSDRMLVIFSEIDEKKKKVAEFTATAWISRVGHATLLTMELPPTAQGAPPVYGVVGYQLLTPLLVRLREVTLDEEARGATSYRLRQSIRRAFKDATLFNGRDELWSKVGEIYWNPEGNPAMDTFAPPRNLR
jgi:hypothetical protein